MPTDTTPVDDSQYAMFEMMMRGTPNPKAAYDMFRSSFGDGPAKAVLARYEKKVGLIRTLRDPITFTNDHVRGWYAGPSETDRFWPALERYLVDKKKWPKETVTAIDSATTKILSLAQHPGQGTIDTKGLVVGYVQSGKTANYTALIAKAADVGYRLFIVLSGIHNSLRRQTEKRLREELIELNNKHWTTLTTPVEDFRPSGHNINAFLADDSHLRILCVVKKNAHVLRRLLGWLKKGESSVLGSCAVMIIDDEADQAGLNASRDPNSRTVINSRLLEIINLLPKVAYIGYTATPFANVLVDPSGNDLYPSSFIAALPRPEAYFGAETLFGREKLDEDDESFETEGLEMIRIVPDNEIDDLRPKSAKTRAEFEPEITRSLQDALDYFLLACTARKLRGSKSHASMLIHTTLYADPHESIGAKVEGYCADRLRSLKRNKKSLLGRLRDLWVDEAPKVPAANWDNPEHEFDDLLPHLAEVASATNVVVENAQSLSRLSYGDEPKTQIVIGGNTLSRGLTLEGLLVSFFVRSASAYDTLLQMGRWFGYRFGYEDLPRVWMTQELCDAFFLLATVEQEVRNDVNRYDAKSLTPTDFGVRIRTHPGMAITSRLKMNSAIDCNVSYSGTDKQTRIFKHEDPEWLNSNIEAARALLSTAGEGSFKPDRHVVYENVAAASVLQFFEEYQILDNPMLQPKMLCEYIRAQNSKRALTKWNVAVVQNSSESPTLGKLPLAPNLEVNTVSRSKKNQPGFEHAHLGTISNQFYFNTDLDEARRKDRRVRRNEEDNPLLVLIPISKNSVPKKVTEDSPKKPGTSRVPLEAAEHILGIGISFPPAKVPTPQKYVSVDLSKLPYYDEEDLYEDDEKLDDGGAS